MQATPLPLAQSAARASITRTVRVQRDGTKAVDVEELFTDGTKQVTSTVYPVGVDPPEVQHGNPQQSVQYASPVPPPPQEQEPCGGHCCLIGGSVALTVGLLVVFCCILPIVLVIVALRATNNILDDFDDDNY